MPPQAIAASGSDPNEDIHEAMLAKRGCCFLMPCLGSRQSSSPGLWQRMRTIELGKSYAEERWWIRGWRKMREWSELVAGPKWKTFIRRLSRNPNCCCGRGGFFGGGSRGQVKFHYDPLSYALNFDDGLGQNLHFDEGFGNRDFSSRYASLPVSTKCSMDLDNDAHLFS